MSLHLNREKPPEIQNPCPKTWDGMAGNAKRRFCEHCQLHVHNLSAMSARQRKRLLTRSNARVCVAYEKDATGFLVTRAAPLRGLLGRFGWTIAGLLASIMPLSLSSCTHRFTKTGKPAMPSAETTPACSHPPEGVTLGGMIAPPTPTPTPSERENTTVRGKILWQPTPPARQVPKSTTP